MTVMTDRVEKKTLTLGHVPGVHPSIHHLPVSTLRDIGGNAPADLDYAAKVAEQVYLNWPDDLWRNGFIMALHSYIDNQVAYHRGELQAMLDKAARRTVKKARRAIIKSYVSDVLDEVSKDRINVHPYTRMGERVSGYTYERQERRRAEQENPAFGGYDPELGYGTAPTGMSPAEARQAGATLAAQMTNAYGAAAGTDQNKQDMTYHVLKSTGQVEVQHVRGGHPPAVGEGDIIVRSIPRGVQHPVNLGGGAFNVSLALGNPAGAAAVHGAVAQNFHDAVAAGGDWGKRLAAVSNVLHHATKADPRVDTALAMARAVGTAGPEVSKVLGGHIRRHLYRYRGVQADSTQWTNVARSKRQETNKGVKEPVSAYQFRLAQNLVDPVEKGGLQAIPNDHEVRVSLATGNTPPSHGFLLDKKGDVVSQAHGYADDHYVPFNLAQLNALNGGSYVRSRAFGGPTTEDFSLASRTGADSFATISRSGMFRVQFTPRTNKAGRKIGEWARDTANDANTVMVNRYGRLLDAVKNGKVKDPENPNETLKLDARGYSVALEALRKQFPYFIHDIEYIEPSKVHSLTGLHGQNEKDLGYVRPYYLKPEEAHAGYHDTKLRGDNDATTFDDDEKYRLGMARIYASRRQPPATGGSGTGGVRTPVPGAPRGTPGAAPTTVPARTRGYVWAARTQDVGAPISEVARRTNRLSEEDSARYLAWIRARLDAAPPDVFIGHDDESTEAREIKTLLGDPESSEAFDQQDTYMEALKNDPDERDRVEKMLDRITPDTTDLTGMERPVLRSINEIPPEEDQLDYESDQDYKDYGQYRRYLQLKGALASGRRNDPAFKLRPEKMAIIAQVEQPDPENNGMSIKDRMEEEDEAYDGLPYWQYYANVLNKVNPAEHTERFRPPEERNPEPSSSRTAVHEGDDPEERDRKSDEYLQDTLRDMTDRDLYG